MDLATPVTASDRGLDAAERALELGQLDECKACLAKCSVPALMRQLQLHTALALLTCTSDRGMWKVSAETPQGRGGGGGPLGNSATASRGSRECRAGAPGRRVGKNRCQAGEGKSGDQSCHPGTGRTQVFELSPEQASAEDVRRRFRALAKLVHPDKTGTGATARAFESLCQGAEALQAQVQAWPGTAPPSDSSGFNWWEEWDDAAPSASSPGTPGPAHSDAAPEDLRDASEAWLRAEAGRRQRELLAPTRDADGRLVPLAQLKQRLESVKQELRRRSASEARWNGGFLPT